MICTAQKVSVFGVILVRIFPHSDHIQSKYGKMRTRITPNKDTFYTVLTPFFLTLDIFCTMSPCFYYWFWTGKYRLGRISKIEGLCDFHINFFRSSFETFSNQSGVYFYISVHRGYYTLQCHNFKANMQEEKTILKIR